jgi:hypothetical protein
LDAFERHGQQVPLSSLDRVMQRDSDGCPAAVAFRQVCTSYADALETEASLTKFNLAYILLLHEFMDSYASTKPQHQSCLIAIFANWYKTVRKRELSRVTAMSLLPPAQPTKCPEYPDLAGFEDEAEEV